MALTDNILAYWKLDNDGSGGVSLLDSTSNGNNLTNNSGGVNLGSGIIGGDAIGNGTGWLTSSTLNLSGDFSVNLWVKNIPTNTTEQASQFFTGTNGVGLGIYGTNTYLGFGKTGVYNDFLQPVSYASEWNMVSVSRNGATISLYLNANLITTFSDSSDFTDNYGLFAQYGGGFVASSNGLNIDEVGIWSRTLSQAEITRLYNNGSGFSYPFINNAFIKFSGNQVSGSSTLLNDILAYWNLDNDGSGSVSLVDSTGNNNTLTNNNGVTLGSGIIAGDAVFSGTQYLSTPNTLIPTTSGAFSVSFWTSSDLNSGTLISSATSGPNSLLIQNYGSTTYVQVQSNGSLIAQFNASTIANIWTHYAFTYDSSGNGVWYQNGTPVDSKNAAGIGTDPAGGFVMGGRWDGYTLVGQLDEIGIWNRALTQAEVTTLYTNPSALNPYPPASLYYNNA